MNEKQGSIWQQFEVIASYTALNLSLKLTQQKLQKKKLQATLKQRTWCGKLRPRYIVSCTINCM